MDQTIKNIKQKGTTLLEALVATAIIGIGFIAVFQMVTYSVRSIDVSGERTKINYLTDMIVEDLMAYKSSKKDSVKLYDALIDDRPTGAVNAFWTLDGCGAGPKIKNENNAQENIKNKWDRRFSQRRLRCNPADNDTKALQTYTICSDAALCEKVNGKVFDKLYFGKIQITFGSKKKNLYFKIH
tara:strand:+ start:1738 stop:2289 length:552 start_codon:yes stop_codon:yes gene_type:complete